MTRFSLSPRRTACAGLLLAMAAGLAAAQSEAPRPEPRAPQVGDATHALLAQQREGAQASATPRPIPGEVAGRSYQRYLKSFEHEIPANFKSSVGERSPGSR
jgi:hypothetical protein